MTKQFAEAVGNVVSDFCDADNAREGIWWEDDKVYLWDFLDDLGELLRAHAHDMAGLPPWDVV